MHMPLMERAQMKVLPQADRANDLWPRSHGLLHACRTCITTNVIGVGLAAIAAAGLGVRRLAKRLTTPA